MEPYISVAATVRFMRWRPTARRNGSSDWRVGRFVSRPGHRWHDLFRFMGQKFYALIPMALKVGISTSGERSPAAVAPME